MLAAIGAGSETVSQKSDVKPPPFKVESPPSRLAGSLPRTTVRDQSATTNGALNASFATTSEGSTGSDPLTNQTNAIYIEHDTAAQKLFRWRSIKALLKQSKELCFSTRMEDYVMEHETNKGVLRIYGRGRQMREVGEGSQSGGSTGSPANSSASAPSEEASTNSSPAASPPEILWGTGFVPTAEPRIGDGIGGLNPDNTLRLDSKTMTRLLKSYLDNIHILHPFLEERGLTRLVEHYRQHYNPVDVTTSKAAFAVPVAVDNLREQKIPKRKHSDGPYYTYMGESTLAASPVSPKVLLDRSPQTALTLLVMALGKICERREPVPGPVSDGSREIPAPLANPYSPLAARYDSPPPSYAMRHSPSSSSHSTANTSAPSPLGPARLGLSSPRSSIGEIPPNTRNVDVIPGLAYYAQASDILGNLTGFHELVNAQCCLLAGLYAGQLANTLESLTWIQSASRICRLLVKK
jgi:DNA-dependent RNA polymerase auxiliary subunit epsilon